MIQLQKVIIFNLKYFINLNLGLVSISLTLNLNQLHFKLLFYDPLFTLNLLLLYLFIFLYFFSRSLLKSFLIIIIKLKNTYFMIILFIIIL